MRLKKTKSNDKTYINKVPSKPYHHNKNISMDMIPSKLQNQSVYLNKILLKNLGTQPPETNFPNFNENIENFQTSIQNIFSNEEKRQKAMKYVINMRSKKGNLSPFELGENKRNSKNNNININNINIFSKTINDGFYDSNIHKNELTEKFDNQDNDYNLKNNKYLIRNKYLAKNKSGYLSQDNKISQIQLKRYTGFNIYSNNMEHLVPDTSMIFEKNKKNKLYEQYQSNKGPKNNMFMKNNLESTLRNISSSNNTKNKFFNNKELSLYPNTTVNKQVFYRKKKFHKPENLYLDNNVNNNYRYAQDDNDNNESDNENNYNNNRQYGKTDESNSNESDIYNNKHYELTFENANNKNNNHKIKEIVIDNINDLYTSQKLEDTDEENQLNKYRTNDNFYNNKKNNIYSRNRNIINKANNKIYNIFNDLKIERKRLSIYSNIDNIKLEIEKEIKESFVDNNKIISNDDFIIKGIHKKDNNNLYHKNNVLRNKYKESKDNK